MGLSFKPHLWASFFCVLIGSLGIGYTLSLLNLLDNQINCWISFLDQNSSKINTTFLQKCQNATERAKKGEFEIYAFRWSAVSSAALFGGILSTVFVPFLDRYGRLSAIRLSVFFGSFGTVLSFLAFYVDSYVALLLGRLIFGLNMGISVMTYPCYLTEIAPETKKSAFGMCFGMFVNFGVVFCMVGGLEWIFGNSERWQYMLISPILIYAIQSVLCLFSVESPSWQRNCGRVKEAEVSESKLYGTRIFDEKCGNNDEIQTDRNLDLYWANYWKSVKECFTVKPVRNKMLICIVLRAGQMSSSIPMLAFYSLGLFQSIGLSSKIAGIGSLGLSIAGSLGSIIGTMIVRKLGIRKVYLISLAGCFSTMIGFFITGFFEGDHVKWIGLVFITLAMGVGNMGVMTLPFALPAIWVPIEYRTICMAVLVIAGLCVVFVWTLLFPYLLIEIGNWTFLCFAVALGANFVYAWVYVKLE